VGREVEESRRKAMNKVDEEKVRAEGRERELQKGVEIIRKEVKKAHEQIAEVSVDVISSNN
jgi:hypothetical protein